MPALHDAAPTSKTNFAILRREILARSVASDWPRARLEWSLVDVYMADIDEDRECLCTHTPIVEICRLRNTVNSTEVEVGNVCVKRFLGLNSHRVFDGVRRVRKDPDKGLNPDASELFFRKGLISEWEYRFSLDTWRKRDLSDRQMSKRREINRRVVAGISRGLRG